MFVTVESQTNTVFQNPRSFFNRRFFSVNTRPQKMTGDQTFDRFTVFEMSSQYMDHKFLDH